MVEPKDRTRAGRAVAALLVLGLAFSPTPVLAHALKLFASAQGQTIVGEAYFTGGGPAAGATVVALGPEGEVLGRATADESGQFVLPVTQRVDHRLIADTAEGHAASFTVPSDDLPPRIEGASAPGALALDESVARQLAPLRRDLARLEERLMWRDILGGLGYIAGLFGVAAFLLSRRRGG